MGFEVDSRYPLVALEAKEVLGVFIEIRGCLSGDATKRELRCLVLCVPKKGAKGSSDFKACLVGSLYCQIDSCGFFNGAGNFEFDVFSGDKIWQTGEENPPNSIFIIPYYLPGAHGSVTNTGVRGDEDRN